MLYKTVAVNAQAVRPEPEPEPLTTLRVDSLIGDSYDVVVNLEGPFPQLVLGISVARDQVGNPSEIKAIVFLDPRYHFLTSELRKIYEESLVLQREFTNPFTGIIIEPEARVLSGCNSPEDYYAGQFTPVPNKADVYELLGKKLRNILKSHRDPNPAVYEAVVKAAWNQLRVLSPSEDPATLQQELRELQFQTTNEEWPKTTVLYGAAMVGASKVCFEVLGTEKWEHRICPITEKAFVYPSSTPDLTVTLARSPLIRPEHTLGEGCAIVRVGDAVYDRVGLQDYYESQIKQLLSPVFNANFDESTGVYIPITPEIAQNLGFRSAEEVLRDHFTSATTEADLADKMGQFISNLVITPDVLSAMVSMLEQIVTQKWGSERVSAFFNTPLTFNLEDTSVRCMSWLYLMAENNVVEAILMLKEAGIAIADDPGHRETLADGRVVRTVTSLYIASENGNIEAARTLLEFGVPRRLGEVELVVRSSELSIAATPEMYTLLREYGARFYAFECSRSSGFFGRLAQVLMTGFPSPGGVFDRLVR